MALMRLSRLKRHTPAFLSRKRSLSKGPAKDSSGGWKSLRLVVSGIQRGIFSFDDQAPINCSFCNGLNRPAGPARSGVASATSSGEAFFSIGRYYSEPGM